MSRRNSEEMIELGYCSKPHGIKGAFSFHLYNQEESILKVGMEIFIVGKDSSQASELFQGPFKIEKIDFGNKAIAFLAGVRDRNQVEAMVPFTIFVPRSSFPPAEEGEFYLSDLRGLKVIEHGTREVIGVVRKHYENGAQLVLVVEANRKIYDIPFVDRFVPAYDVVEGWVEVILPEMDS